MMVRTGRGNGLITKMSKQPGVEHDLARLKRRGGGGGGVFPGLPWGTRHAIQRVENGDVSQEARLFGALKLRRDSETPAERKIK